ncbi:MAG: hypothetical protein H5U40_04985 [Polyangiaceae bacterium]|nr:hypothetical protein [Polyangiaceae bacterium]
MQGSHRNLVISLLVVGAFAGLGFFLLVKNAHLPQHPLERAPAGAEMAAWVDVPKLRGSSLWQRFVVESGEDAAMRQLAERCGFDPVGQVKNLTAFVTGGEGMLEHVGLVAEGEFDHEALGRCLRSAVTEDGGTLREVEIEGARAVASGHGPSRAAFVGATGIVAGHEETVASALRAIAGREGSLGLKTELRALWDRLARNRDIVAVAAIPERWQEGLQRLLGAARANVLAPHLTELKTLGLGARVSRGLGMTLVAVTSSEEAATTLATTARDALQRLMSNPLVMISPAGAVLSNLETRTEGAEVIVGLDITEERLTRIFGFADRMLGALGGPAPSAAAAATAAPAEATPTQAAAASAPPTPAR